MLHNVLCHHLIIELKRALLGQVVVDLTLLGLDDVGALGVNRVGEGVFLEVDLAGAHLFVQVVLVPPAGLLLVHETTRGGLVLFDASSVELAHHFVELIHMQIVADAARFIWRGARLRVQERIKFSLHLCNLVLKFLVVEHVATRAQVSGLIRGDALTEFVRSHRGGLLANSVVDSLRVGLLFLGLCGALFGRSFSRAFGALHALLFGASTGTSLLEVMSSDLGGQGYINIVILGSRSWRLLSLLLLFTAHLGNAYRILSVF